jgi:hypothetical protein
MNDNIISNGPRFYDQNGTLFSFKYVHPRIGKYADYPAEDYCMRLDGKWNFDGDAIVKVGLIVRVYEDSRDKVGKLGQIQCIYISNPEKGLFETTKYAVVLTDGDIINPFHFVIIYEPIDGCDRGYIKNCGYIGTLKDFPHLVSDTTTTTTISNILDEEKNQCGIFFKIVVKKSSKSMGRLCHILYGNLLTMVTVRYLSRRTVFCLPPYFMQYVTRTWVPLLLKGFAR